MVDNWGSGLPLQSRHQGGGGAWIELKGMRLRVQHDVIPAWSSSDRSVGAFAEGARRVAAWPSPWHLCSASVTLSLVSLQRADRLAQEPLGSIVEGGTLHVAGSRRETRLRGASLDYARCVCSLALAAGSWPGMGECTSASQTRRQSVRVIGLWCRACRRPLGMQRCSSGGPLGCH